MHAFDGKASTALAGMELGFYFSIPPSMAVRKGRDCFDGLAMTTLRHCEDPEQRDGDAAISSSLAVWFVG